MNKVRRLGLEKIIEALESIKEELSVLAKEEEEYRDNIPENLQTSERYEKAEAACDSLSDADASIDEAIDFIMEAIA